MEQATKPAARTRCACPEKAERLVFLLLQMEKDWASQTIDSHDKEIDRAKGGVSRGLYSLLNCRGAACLIKRCRERSNGGEAGGAIVQREKPLSTSGRKTRAVKGD